MQKVRMNISHFRFVLFNMKIFAEKSLPKDFRSECPFKSWNLYLGIYILKAVHHKPDQVNGKLWNSKAIYFRSDYQQP